MIQLNLCGCLGCYCAHFEPEQCPIESAEAADSRPVVPRSTHRTAFLLRGIAQIAVGEHSKASK